MKKVLSIILALMTILSSFAFTVNAFAAVPKDYYDFTVTNVYGGSDGIKATIKPKYNIKYDSVTLYDYGSFRPVNPAPGHWCDTFGEVAWWATKDLYTGKKTVKNVGEKTFKIALSDGATKYCLKFVAKKGKVTKTKMFYVKIDHINNYNVVRGSTSKNSAIIIKDNIPNGIYSCYYNILDKNKKVVKKGEVKISKNQRFALPLPKKGTYYVKAYFRSSAVAFSPKYEGHFDTVKFNTHWSGLHKIVIK